MVNEFNSMINFDEEWDPFEDLPGDHYSPIEAERISAIGRESTLWEDS